MKQFPDVGTMYGSPMGRSESPLGEGVRSVRVFRVNLDSGGYDDGGAYWGHGEALYCAQCDEGGIRFMRADGRLSAIAKLGIRRQSLKQPPIARFARLLALEQKGTLSAQGVLLRQALQDLGF